MAKPSEPIPLNRNPFLFLGLPEREWVNNQEFVPESQRLGPNAEDITMAEFLNTTKRYLCLLLLALHPIHNFILDVSMLVEVKDIPAEEIVYMIRDAIIEAEFCCDAVRILWPPTVPQTRMDTLLNSMWGEEEL